jgi:hypothetical protein
MNVVLFFEISIADSKSIWRYRPENFDIYKMYVEKFASYSDKADDSFAFYVKYFDF